MTVKGSQSLGIQVREGGGFAPGSQELSITGGASFRSASGAGLRAPCPPHVHGNATDEIILPALGGRDDIKEDTTLAARGVPYRIGGPTGGKSLVVAGAASVPLLTIEPGVTLRFDKDARLDLDGTGAGVALGALRAEGTAERPIVFTSSATAPAAGAWVGIVIEGTPDPRDRIAHAKISFAGASSQISSFDCPRSSGTFSNDGAILVVGGKPRAPSSLTPRSRAAPVTASFGAGRATLWSSSRRTRSRTSPAATRPSPSRRRARAPIPHHVPNELMSGILASEGGHMGSGRVDVHAQHAIDIVETAYRLEGTEAEWLDAVLRCARPDLDTGCGVYAFTGNEDGPKPRGQPGLRPARPRSRIRGAPRRAQSLGAPRAPRSLAGRASSPAVASCRRSAWALRS